MPEHVAERIEPAVVIARAQLISVGQVRDVRDLGVLQAPDDTVVAGRRNGAEPVAEREQLILVKGLIMKDEDGVAIDRGRDLGDIGRG
jgi:hypothetical protein